MATGTLLKQQVAKQGLLVAVALVVVAAVAVGGAYLAYTSPTTTTVTKQTDQQTIATGVNTSAVVTGNTTLYRRGSRLRNMPVYLLSASPNLTLTVRTSVPAGQPVTVSQELDVVFQASRDGKAFYTDRRPLVNQSARTASGVATASSTVNVTRLRGEIQRTQAEIGGVGTFDTRLDLAVTYRTDKYHGRLTASSPIQITDGAYWLGSDLAVTRRHSTPVTRQVTEPPDPVTYLGLLGVALAALLAAGGVLYGWRTFDGDALEAELVRSRYDEWISTGEFPTGTGKRYTGISTLEDLVDVAIDSNKRVLFDPDIDAYAVVDSDVVYYYSPDPFNVDAWLDT